MYTEIQHKKKHLEISGTQTTRKENQSIEGRELDSVASLLDEQQRGHHFSH